MESGNGGASSKGILIPVPDSSDVFKSSILAPLQSAYLYDESKQFFRYKSAVLVKNSAQEEKYNAFRAKRREAGYSEEDLEESYGFLLFDDVSKANNLGATGVLTGNSTCTTLGDPSKGVYISMHSDCLDLNRWYHGKSGYIAIIRLTKGKVNKVSENYTQNFTAPTVGFDSHVSEQFPSVSAQTSSFLAFERTQCYMYELLDDGSNGTAQSPSAACPFAIVSFSYTDNKATIEPPQEKSKEKKLVFCYLPWRGQLQIGSQFYSVGLRSNTGALIPTKLPPVVKVDRSISMLHLRHLLPRAVFETCFTGEAFLDGLYCTLCELVSTEAEETNSLTQLLWKIKEKDLALVVLLNDGGFLILLHSTHFLTYDDIGSCSAEILQGLFVFPDSRVVMKDTKFGQKNSSMTSEILRILPVLSYAEGEIEKAPIDPSEELCEVLAQHMQSYTALINPGLASGPSREVSMFPFQYDVPDAHKHLYSSPEWTDGSVQRFRSYLSKPSSFQLPVSKASEILVAGQEERREDLDDDVYICLSSPEEVPISTVLDDKLPDLDSPDNVETSVDSGTVSTGAQDDLTAVPHNMVPNDLQPEHPTKDYEKCSDLCELNKTDNVEAETLLTPPTSDDLPAELIFSITSAEQSVTDETLNLTAKLQTAEVNSLSESDYTKKLLDIPEVTNFRRRKRRKMRRGPRKGWKKLSKVCVEASGLQAVKTPLEVDKLTNSQQDENTKELPGDPQLSNPPNWRKLQRRKSKCVKLSSYKRKLRSASILMKEEEKSPDPGLQSLESTILMELEVSPLRRKMERWDLKPIISECGRILVPFGSADIADQIKSLKDKLQSTKDEQCPEKMVVEAPMNAHDTVKIDLGSSTAPEVAVDEVEVTKTVDGGSTLQNITASDVNPEQNILRQSDDGNCSVPLNLESSSSKSNDTDTHPSQAVQEKHTDNLYPEKCPTKSEFLLRKLKSVLLRGKRKADLVTEDTTPNTPQDTEPSLKKSKEVDSETEVLKGSNTNAQSTNAAVNEVSTMLPVDPLFAYALGLTPKEIPEKVTKTQDQDTKQRTDSTKLQEQTFSDKQSEIIHKPVSIFTRRGRIKTLKKHQSVSAECIKKKWWLHFQTPACFASEKLNYKDCTSDNSVRKTVKEKMNSACSSADALNLLADLALGAGNDQVPPQPNPAFERKPETSLKKSDLKKDLTSAEQESVLHALLRKPSAKTTQPHESPAPSHLVVHSELVGLVSKEHAYSLPPSSSLLLGLPGTPFQVSPISGSSRLLHHHQTVYGIKALQPSPGQEDRSEHNRTPDYLKKHMMRKHKFRFSRTIVIKEGSIKVTRQWTENYDFNLDSKFTSDSKDKTVIRALHGPWDFSVQDTNEEVRLIVHMWIGLFYSRSTARFFHVDSSFKFPCSEESESFEMATGVISGLANSEHKATAPVSFASVTDTSDALSITALDLSKKDHATLDQDYVALDLSLRNSSAESFTSDPKIQKKETFEPSGRKESSETLNYLKSPQEHHECYGKMVNFKEIVSEVTNDRKDNENEKTGTPRKAVRLENADIPSSRVDGKVIPPQESINSASIKFNTTLAILAIGQVFNGCDKERINLEEATEKSGTEERGLIQQDVMDSFRSVTDEKEDFNMEAQDAIQTNDHEKNGSKNLGSYKIKENPCQEGNIDLSQKVDYASDDFANKESDIICNGNCLESKKLLSREERKEVSKEQAEHFKGVTDCSPKPEGEVIKEDNHLKKDQTDEKDECISVLKVDKDLSDQPLPEMCNGPELAQENCITQSNHQAQMNEQLSLVNSTKDAHDMPLKMLCSDGIVLTDDHAISEKVPHTLLEMDSLATESLSEEISKTGICLRDEEQFKKAVLPMSDESLSMPQTKVNFETENQNTDFNFGQCNDVHEEQENKSEEEEVKVDSVTQKEQCQHQPHSPHCEVSKMYETQVAFAKETDLGTDKTNEGLDKNHTGVEIPFIGIDTSREHEIQVKAGKATCIEPFQHKPHSPQCEAQQAFTNEAVLRADKTNHGLDKACTGVKFSFIGVDASGEDKIQNANHKEQFQHQPYAPQCEVPKTCREQVAFTKETDLKTDKTNERLDKCCTGVEIPFIGIHVTGEDTEQPHGSHTQGSAEEVVQGLEEIPFISDCSSLKAALPNEMCSVSQVCSEKAEPFKISLPDGNEIYQPLALGGESDNRCPTPTIDEKPYGYMSCSSPNGDTSAFSGSETGVNPDHKCLSTSITPVKDDLNCDKKLCHSSTVNCDSNPYPVFHPDELRTLRVLQSIDKFFYTDKSSQNETIKMKESVDQSPDPSKCIPGSLSSDEPSFDFKKKNTGNEKPAVVSASTSHILQKEPSDCLLVSPFKGKLEKVLGVKLQLKKTDSNSQDYFEGTNTQETSAGQDGRFYRPCPSELLQVITSSLDQDRPKPTSQSNVNQEPRPYSQRPVMAVKPSKSDERQVDSFSKDVHTEKFSKNKLPKCPKLVYTTPASMLIEKRTKEKSKGNSERLNDNHETSELSLKNNWFSNVSHSKSNSDDARFAILDPSYQCQRRDISKFNRIPSLAPSKQSFDSAECSSKLVDGIQSFLTNGLVEESEKKIKVSIEIDRKNSTDASASFMDHRDNELIDDDQILAPQSSLICTVYNTGQTKSHSFLEQVSQRCLQEDLTQASMEQECLIFSEQMKQLLKKMERGAIRQEDIHDNKRLSCTSPLTINFSNLDEQEDSLDHFDVSLVGQKIKVGLSKEDLTDTTEEEKTTHPRELSQGKYNTVELAWVSDMTAECARLYEAKMHDVCAFKNVSSRTKSFWKSQCYLKTEPSNHFDFCDQMKREMDKTFRTNLNSVVKKSCRTKYRFYILATSDDVFFEHTKAQLEAEGHTAVQPAEFFLGEDSSSSLLIILRNEDIAEHICEVPHLLELKKTPGVHFAGIDEPDDVVNLTHQELFTQGGFIMFDRAAVDSLSLCNMKKVSEILLELSKMGKWKWMLHYRDSRRLKENARLSAEAKEKKHFLCWGQDAGILEVLPYHDCDQMSRDQPDYLSCLVRLQVQKISSRYSVFITDMPTDSTFEKNGILTMTSNAFLTKPLSETFTV